MKRAITTTDPKTAQKHLKKSTSMGGAKIGFALNSKGTVIELLYKGQPTLKAMKKLTTEGYTQFVYTFAFLPFTKQQIATTIDLMTDIEVLGAFAKMAKL